MKKFISFVMAAAMVASLVPATAFAKGEVTATAKVVDAKDVAKSEAKDYVIAQADAPELQLKVTGTDYRVTEGDGADKPTMEVTVTLDNADFTTPANGADYVSVRDKDGNNLLTGAAGSTTYVEDPDGAYLKKGNDVIEKATVKGKEEITGWNAVEERIKAGAVLAVAGTPGYDITISKATGSSTTTTIVYSNADGAFKVTATELVAALQDGFTFDGHRDEVQLKWTDGAADKTLGFDYIEDGNFADVNYAATTDAEELAALEADGYKSVKKVVTGAADARLSVRVKDHSDDEIVYEFEGFFKKDDVVAIDLASKLTKYSEGTKATVSVDSKMVTTSDDLTFATVVGAGIKASVKKTVDVAEEEVTKIYEKGVKIEPVVGKFTTAQEITVKLNSGFEFITSTVSDANIEGASVKAGSLEDNSFILIPDADAEEIIIGGEVKIEATSAKAGATATLKLTQSKGNSVSVEIAKVVDYKVILSVDEDDDVPVIYSGVNVENKGITDDSDHLSLEVTAEETFPGAWSMRKGFNFTLPEGVYVTEVDVTEYDGLYWGGHPLTNDAVVDAAFFNAYQDGDHMNFEFDKRVFDDVNTNLNDEKAKIVFQLTLVADPTFEGDVVLGFSGDLVDAQEVTIAKFVKPYTVKAEQNDLIIDYRNTEVPTAITITEAEAGLWAKDATFALAIDKEDYIEFEDDATFTVDDKSDMTIKNEKTDNGKLSFAVKAESDDTPATITIKDIKLFMQRNIPAGAYALKMDVEGTQMLNEYASQGLFAPDHVTMDADGTVHGTINGADDHQADGTITLANRKDHKDSGKDCIVNDVTDYSKTVKEAFINVVTAGRDQDDASFTTKVVVPVGESYLISGETKVDLDVPAYISAAGYTMLPVRAVAKALGVNNNSVIWNAEARTVTILYGQRIVTMTVGSKVMTVNGSSIPTSAAVEITNERTFLPMRDLATALGVTDITWDAATRTATMNGSK